MVDRGERIAAGDQLVFEATEEGIAALWRTPVFGMAAQRLYAVSVGPGEPASLHDFERDGSLRIIAARDRPLHETDLDPGETCYVTGASEEAVARSPAVALWQRATSRAPQPSKTFVALGVLLCVIVSASFGLVPAEVAASGGALVMVLTGVITPRSAVRALDPKVLGLLAGSIGLGAIVVESGLADVIADAIADLSHGTLGLVVVLAVATTVMTNLVTNAATASIHDGHAAGRLHDRAVRPLRRPDPRRLPRDRLRRRLRPAERVGSGRMERYDAIVIGGGFAGVTAARDLSHGGARVLLLEARDRLGGRTWMRRLAGTTVELEFGGTWVLVDEHHDVMEELARYGIGTVPTPAPTTFMSLLGDERVGGNLCAEELAAVDAELRRAVAEAAPGTTIAELLDRADLTPRARAWTAAYVRYLYGADPSELAAAGLDYGEDALSVADPEHYSHKIQGGTRRLLEAIAADAGAAARLGATVSAVEHDGDGVLVTLAGGERFAAAVAVVALPVNTWDRVAFVPPLEADKRALAEQHHAGHSVKVWLVATGMPETFRGLDSSGPIAYLRTERALPGGRSLLVGFSADVALDPRDTAAVQAAVRRFVPDAQVLASDGHDWNGDPFAAGTWFAPRPDQEAASARLADPEGRLLFAGGDMGAHAGTIDAAIASGRAAAAAALAVLAPQAAAR
jgi:monoamine oxidase